MSNSNSNSKKPRRGRRAKPAAQQRRPGSKEMMLIEMLRRAEGATVAQLMGATGWQAHSVRGFLSRVVRKEIGLAFVREDGVYRIVA